MQVWLIGSNVTQSRFESGRSDVSLKDTRIVEKNLTNIFRKFLLISCLFRNFERNIPQFPTAIIKTFETQINSTGVFSFFGKFLRFLGTLYTVILQSVEYVNKVVYKQKCEFCDSYVSSKGVRRRIVDPWQTQSLPISMSDQSHRLTQFFNQQDTGMRKRSYAVAPTAENGKSTTVMLYHPHLGLVESSTTRTC